MVAMATTSLTPHRDPIQQVSATVPSPTHQLQQPAPPVVSTPPLEFPISVHIDDVPIEDIQLEGSEDPRNWSPLRKWSTTIVIALMGFISPLGSSIVIPGAHAIDMAFNLRSRLLSLLPVSFFVLGLGAGPFCLAPISELKGRQPVYIATSIIFVVFNVGTATVQTFYGLCILRFFAGVFGSTGPSLGAGSIGDMFAPNERGRAQSLYGLGPLLGPVIGNIVGGWIDQVGDHYWRWLLWLLTILSGLIALVIIFCLQETYAPVLLQKKRKRIAAERVKRLEALKADQAAPLEALQPQLAKLEAAADGTGKLALKRRIQALIPGPTGRTKMKQAFSRPFRLLFTNPICAIFSCYLGFCYGIIFLFLVEHPLLYQRREGTDAPSPKRLPTYNWNAGFTGLTYTGLGLGFVSAALINAFVQDRIYRRLVASRGTIGWYLFKSPEEIDVIMLKMAAKVHGADIESIQQHHYMPPTPPAAVPAEASKEAQAPPPPLPTMPAAAVVAGDIKGEKAPFPPATREAAPMSPHHLPLATPLASPLGGGSPVATPPFLATPGADPSPPAGPMPLAAALPPTPRKGEPEFRLPLCLFGMLILPLGLFLFGWAAQGRLHWIVPLLGSYLVGAGTILCFQSILVYLVDAFIPFSASATACAVLVRSILAATFPLFAEDMYAALGFGWGSTLLAGVAFCGVPAPLILFRFGGPLRNKFKFSG